MGTGLGAARYMLNSKKLLEWDFRDVRCNYQDTTTISYGLCIGLGDDPADRSQLDYVYEKNLKAFPTMTSVLGMYDDVGFLDDPEVGIDLSRMLHTEMGLTVHAPIPASGELVSRMSIDRLIDRGEGRGAILDFSRELRDAGSEELVATEHGSFFLRGNGGFGGSQESRPRLPETPDRNPDISCEVQTSRQSALRYRLFGDHNPIHADPDVARAAGLPSPILHGACTFGIAAHGVVKGLLDYQAERLRGISARFSAPVIPGDTLRVDMWKTEPGKARFRVISAEQNATVVDNGVAEFEE